MPENAAPTRSSRMLSSTCGNDEFGEDITGASCRMPTTHPDGIEPDAIEPDVAPDDEEETFDRTVDEGRQRLGRSWVQLIATGLLGGLVFGHLLPGQDVVGGAPETHRDAQSVRAACRVHAQVAGLLRRQLAH